MRNFFKSLLFPPCLLLIILTVIIIIVSLTHPPEIPEWLLTFMTLAFLSTWSVSTLSYAKRKGYSWWVWAVVGFIFPGISFFLLIFLPDRKGGVLNIPDITIEEKFLPKEEYLELIKENPDLYVWKTYEDYIENSRDGIPLVKIPREDIIETKKILKKDFENRGMIAYDEMLASCLEGDPAIVNRMNMIPGTKKLQYLLNFVILLSRILIISGIVLLISSVFLKFRYKSMWITGTSILFLNYFVSAYLQTEINFELAARLVTLEQKMGHFNLLEN